MAFRLACFSDLGAATDAGAGSEGNLIGTLVEVGSQGIDRLAQPHAELLAGSLEGAMVESRDAGGGEGQIVVLDSLLLRLLGNRASRDGQVAHELVEDPGLVLAARLGDLAELGVHAAADEEADDLGIGRNAPGAVVLSATQVELVVEGLGESAVENGHSGNGHNLFRVGRVVLRSSESYPWVMGRNVSGF